MIQQDSALSTSCMEDKPGYHSKWKPWIRTQPRSDQIRSDQIEEFVKECQPYKQTVLDHTAEMVKIQQEIFPKTMSNIEKIQEKQKLQYLKRKGISEIKITDGDLVLRRNMLQKTKKGYKMQDHWLGPLHGSECQQQKRRLLPERPQE